MRSSCDCPLIGDGDDDDYLDDNIIKANISRNLISICSLEDTQMKINHISEIHCLGGRMLARAHCLFEFNSQILFSHVYGLNC